MSPKMKDVVGSTLCCILWPIICLLNRRIERRNQIRNGTRAPGNHKPAALKLRSRRPVTPPLPEPSLFSFRPKQKYEEQSESHLFSKLPPELRLMIWELCLSDGVHIRIKWSRGHLAGSPWLPPGRTGFDGNGHGPFRIMNTSGKTPHKNDPAHSRGRVALLLTCRRMYTETVNLVYSLPLFDFTASCQSLMHIHVLLLPHRMHQITKITCSWDCQRRLPLLGQRKPDYLTQVWTGVWGNLTQMQGLKFLKVRIIFTDFMVHLWVSEKENILKSLEGVRGRGLERLELLGFPFELDPM